MIDGGTVGAGGPLAIGNQAIGFAEVRLAEDRRLLALDLIEVEPLSGEAEARRYTFDRP